MRRSRENRGFSRSPSTLVGAQQLRLRQDVTVHRAFETRLVRPFDSQLWNIEGVELEEVAMPADRRAGAAPCRLLPVVESHLGPGRKARRAGAFGEAGGGCRYVVEHPVDPDGLGRPRI